MYNLVGLNICTSEFLGHRVQVRFPKPTVKKYKQRIAKRYARDPRNWEHRGSGQFYIVGGNTVWCHPDDMHKLRAAVCTEGRS